MAFFWVTYIDTQIMYEACRGLRDLAGERAEPAGPRPAREDTDDCGQHGTLRASVGDRGHTARPQPQ